MYVDATTLKEMKPKDYQEDFTRAVGELRLKLQARAKVERTSADLRDELEHLLTLERNMLVNFVRRHNKKSPTPAATHHLMHLESLQPLPKENKSQRETSLEVSWPG
ncbi:hypothetical protein D8674_010563 [Pyrus ussuriensis x Pyrus communis]|uniref:Uncharacterized protein n=1 Tax=Pyrus ussuriensis x Pyrus communis TaxID=2448454 RepID=A0A5N5FGC5_9ROSA|nr:hypothetical protein D8674_010563 [Pyrus ussuriensis x Pyrus communis]